jgi:hypothetical protein
MKVITNAYYHWFKRKYLEKAKTGVSTFILMIFLRL